MRALARLSLVALVTTAIGCTLLVQFDEVDGSAEDAGAPVRDATPGRDADLRDPDSGPSEGGPLAFPPPCDPDFPLEQVQCNPDYPRPNCAKTTAIFPSYPAGHARGEDLVTCNGGTAPPTCVQHCPFGCATMPAGYPDACDDCNGRADGTYCMKDLRGTDARNLGLAVDCKAGRIVATYNCGVGRCATDCPRADRSPSCCI